MAWEASATATVQVRGGDGAAILSLRLSGGAEPGLEADHAGLAAYLAIHHHGGAISIPAWSASGGRVEVVLGGGTDDGLEAFLGQFARSER